MLIRQTKGFRPLEPEGRWRSGVGHFKGIKGILLFSRTEGEAPGWSSTVFGGDGVLKGGRDRAGQTSRVQCSLGGTQRAG